MSRVSGGIDGLEAVFDDGSLVADAGLLLAGTVMSRLGLEALIDDTVRPDGSAGSGAGRKVLSLVASMLVGGCCIDDVQRLRSGSAAAVLQLWGGGAVDCGVVFAVVHVRACAPARQSGRAGASPGVVCGRGAGRRGDDGGLNRPGFPGGS